MNVYPFVEAEQVEQRNVAKACALLKVSRTAYYQWSQHQPSTRAREDEALGQQIERIHHVHHAGNSSGIVDGAAAVLVGNAAAGERHGLRARARIRATAVVGDEPVLMLAGPMPATERALKKPTQGAMPSQA